MSKSEIKVALIGYGGAFNMGLHHRNAMEATGRMRVVAVCDQDPARLATAKEELGAQTETFTEVSKLLKWGKFDLAIIILPHNLHAPVAIQCLKAGKHVITEKPMCITVKEATAMIDAAQASKVMLSVFHNRRWDGDFLALRQIVESGLIGKVFQVEIFAGGWSAPRGWWRDDKAISGGLGYDWGAHFMYWLLQLVPAPIADVTGFSRKLVWKQMTNEDQLHAIIRFADGTVADFQQSQIARVGKPRWRVLGDKGGVLAGHDHWVVNTEVNGLATEMKIPFLPGEHQKYYENIAAHILDKAKLIVTAEDARRVIGVIEYAERSAKAGKAVKIPHEG
jgi:predicted dehydrogenase